MREKLRFGKTMVCVCMLMTMLAIPVQAQESKPDKTNVSNIQPANQIQIVHSITSQDLMFDAKDTDNGVVCSWKHIPGMAVCTLYRKTPSDKQWTQIASAKSDVQQITDTSVAPGEEYQYHLDVIGRNIDVSAIQNLKADVKTTLNANHIRNMKAGTIIPQATVDAVGLDSFFYAEPISDETFARMWGKSFKYDCTIPREQLNYIRCLHKDMQGNIMIGELVMNVQVAQAVCDIMKQLYLHDYPIERMVLVDEYDADDETSIMHNNTSAFNYRTVAGTNEISQHAYGYAIDINPYYNVYYIPSQNYIFPYDGWAYLDRTADFPYKLAEGDLCYTLFTNAGFAWGGYFTYNIDYQHFYYVG